MRSLIRIIISVITIILVGLLVFTAETVVDEIGFTAVIRLIVRNGWSAMIEAGYADWLLYGVIFFGGASAALWIDFLLRPKNPFKGTKIKIEKTVRNQHFINKEVILDGISYEDCTFQNVTFVHDGGIVRMHNNSIAGCSVKTNQVEIETHISLLAELKFISVPVLGSQGLIEHTGISFVDTITPETDDPHQSHQDTETKTPR